MDEGFVGRNNFVVFCGSDRPSQNGHVTHSAVQINVVRGCVSTVLALETMDLAYLDSGVRCGHQYEGGSWFC